MARDADLFYACTLSSFPYCLLAGRMARVPQVVDRLRQVSQEIAQAMDGAGTQKRRGWKG